MNSHISDMISHNLCDISYMKVTNEPFKLEIHLRQDICSEILASVERTLINPPPIQFKCLLSPIPSQESKISDLIALNNPQTRSSKHQINAYRVKNPSKIEKCSWITCSSIIQFIRGWQNQCGLLVILK